MSREFGTYGGGYFHERMNDAADDLAGGNDGISKAWAKFFDEFRYVAYSIATSEAGDSAEYAPILETIRRMPALQKALDDVANYVQPFKDVAEYAVRNASEIGSETHIVRPECHRRSA